jgi:hypothetical protein
MSDQPKRRPRRIAADEAHAWARNLRLNNPLGKLTLSMLTLYVDGEGSCFVSIEQLAEDTELAADTVRKRLAWLEAIGALARFPQWVDASGRRNGDGRGRRTSDEIRLLITADEGEIESRAQGGEPESSSHQKNATDGENTSVSPRSVTPSPERGANGTSPRLAPPVALCQPSDSRKGQTLLNLNMNLKSPPIAPLRGALGPTICRMGKQAKRGLTSKPGSGSRPPSSNRSCISASAGNCGRR